MSEYNNFDSFIDGLKESDFALDKNLQDKILRKAVSKIKSETNEGYKEKPAREKRVSFLSIRNIAAAGLLLLLLSAIIPNSPVNALYQKIFSYIPGVGVVRNESGEDLIKGALDESVRVHDNDEFLEVESAYITDNALHVTIITNVGTSRIADIKDKKEVLKYFSGETMPGIYLQVGNHKVKLSSYTSGSPSLETKAYTVKGLFYLDENTPSDALFRITMDGFDKTAEFTLSPVKNGVTPESMGSTITVNDIMVFANTERSDGILSVDLSTVANKKYRGVRFNLFDDEKALFQDSVYILDKDGTKYLPDEDLRKQNNSGISKFYFRVPDNKEAAKVVIPQILYSIDYASGIKMNMPKTGKAIDIKKKIELGASVLSINKASLIPRGDSVLPQDFKEVDCLRIDYGTKYKDNSDIRILRIIPDIQVPDSLMGYRPPSSGAYSELRPLDSNEGYALVNFEDMDKTKRFMLDFEIEFAILGPFEMEIRK